MPLRAKLLRFHLIAPFLWVCLSCGSASAAQFDIHGPAGSAGFGYYVNVLPNGNIVVVDTAGPVSGIGAVYLYTATGVLISTLTGSTANDNVGIGGIKVLNSGHFLVLSPNWDNGAAVNAGAVTWVNAETGLNAAITPANSLVGSSNEDRVGKVFTVTLLANGHYVAATPDWDNGTLINVGAVTWGNGATGTSGAISPGNSIIGSSANDRVGDRIHPLSNGRFLIASPAWDRGGIVDAGAISLVNGTGVVGVVSSSNSLVGGAAGDQIGSGFFGREVGDSNFVLGSPFWDFGGATDVGAISWIDGNVNLTGVISPANSLVGSNSNDLLGYFETAVHRLTNGNYVITVPEWKNASGVTVGAARWADGNSPLSGTINSSNALVGGSAGDLVGSRFAALSNGNYVVGSVGWDNAGGISVGAATWGDGATGIVGFVSSSNSLVGSSTNDFVGNRIVALSNGNYVVSSANWDNGALQDVGAATWANGTIGLTGVVQASNSLTGTQTGDLVSSNLVALTNGNYVVQSSEWNNGSVIGAGAVTWANGTTGLVGTVSPGNSLVGSQFDDSVGLTVTPLVNGNFVVESPRWSNGTTSNVGAVTWVNGATGKTGVVSNANSLHGGTAGDNVGYVTALSDASYVVGTGNFDNGAIANAGALTWSRSTPGVHGLVDASNSILGLVTSPGQYMTHSFDDYIPSRKKLVIGRYYDNIVTVITVPVNDPFANGFANGFE